MSYSALAMCQMDSESSLALSGSMPELSYMSYSTLSMQGKQDYKILTARASSQGGQPGLSEKDILEIVYAYEVMDAENGR